MKSLFYKFARSLLQGASDYFFGYDFFISYSHSDGIGYPKALQQALESKRIRTCLDENVYVAGDHLPNITYRRIKMSSKLLLVANREALESSKWVPIEVQQALDLGKSVILIDINSTFSQLDDSNELKQRLQDFLRLDEQIDSEPGVPSEGVLGGLEESLSSLKRDDKRILMVSFAAIIFAAIALVATTLFFKAESERKEAFKQLAYAKISEVVTLFQAERHLDGREILRSALPLLDDAAAADTYPWRVLDATNRGEWRRPLLVLRGGGDPVQEVALSSNGQLAASWSYRKIQVWSTTDGSQLHEFKFPQDGGSGSESFIAFTKDNSALLIGGDLTLQSLDLSTGNLRMLWKRKNFGRDLKYYPQFDLITVVLESRENKNVVQAFSTEQEQEVWEFSYDKSRWDSGERSPFVYSAVLIDETRVALAGMHGTSIWNRETEELLVEKAANEKSPNYNGSLDTDSLKQYLAHWVGTGEIMSTDNLTRTYFAIKGASTDIAFLPDSKHAVAGGYGGGINNWYLYPTGRPFMKFFGSGLKTNAVAVSADGKLSISGADNGVVELWNLTEQLGVILQDNNNNLNVLKISEQGDLALGKVGDSIHVWDLEAGKSLASITKGSYGNASTKIALSALGDFVAIKPYGETAFRWHWRTEKQEQLPVWPDQFSRDGNYFYKFAKEGGIWELSIFSSHTLRRQRTVNIEIQDNPVYADIGNFQIVENASLITAIGPPPTNELMMWNLNTGQYLNSSEESGVLGWPRIARRAPAGTRFAVGRRDGSILLLDENLKHERVLIGHEGEIRGIYWRDNDILVSVSETGELRVWDAGTGRSVVVAGQPQNFSITVEDVLFARDGELIIVVHRAGVNSERNYYVWDIAHMDKQRLIEAELAKNGAASQVTTASQLELLADWFDVRGAHQ